MTMRTYLGDAVYATYDGHMLTLTTEDGVNVSNTIHLEPGVLLALDIFRKRCFEASQPMMHCPHCGGPNDHGSDCVDYSRTKRREL